MTKKRLVQLGVIGCLVLVLAAGGFIAYRKGKLFGRADVLPNPINLTATLPSAADDMAQNHWAQSYVDAVTKYIYGVGKNEPIMAPIMYDANGLIVNTPGANVAKINFTPDVPIFNEQVAFYILRLKGISVSGCSGMVYKDITSSSNYAWACSQIEAAAEAGYFNGTPFAPTTPAGYFNPGSRLNVSIFKKILTNAGVTTNKPDSYPYLNANGTTNDSYITSRVIAAAFIAFNAKLSGTSPYPSVYLQWNFPSDPNAGFDFGYEVWRYDPKTADWSLVYVQDPPEQGMEEASDLGMFYDKTVFPGQTFTYKYKVLLMNRAGDYSGASQVTIKVP